MKTQVQVKEKNGLSDSATVEVYFHILKWLGDHYNQTEINRVSSTMVDFNILTKVVLDGDEDDDIRIFNSAGEYIGSVGAESIPSKFLWFQLADDVEIFDESVHEAIRRLCIDESERYYLAGILKNNDYWHLKISLPMTKAEFLAIYDSGLRQAGEIVARQLNAHR